MSGQEASGAYQPSGPAPESTPAPYYQADGITLYHGDCRKIPAWLAADVLVTDPPYGMGYIAHATNRLQITGELPMSRRSDRVIGEEHVALRDEALSMWGQRPALVFGSWRAPRPLGTQMRLVWDKELFGSGGVGVWKHSDEEIYLLSWPNPRGLAPVGGSVLRFRSLRGESRPDHPTPKPVKLMAYLLDHAPPGVVAEPFAGSGATLLAARATGRQAIGVEVEERFCELIASRLAQGDLFGDAA